jgi:hypothetical protein
MFHAHVIGIGVVGSSHGGVSGVIDCDYRGEVKVCAPACFPALLRDRVAGAAFQLWRRRLRCKGTPPLLLLLLLLLLLWFGF